MTTLAAVRLVAARELRVKLRDKTFLFSTLFFLVVAVASTVVPALLEGSPPVVAVSRSAAGAEPALKQAGMEVRVVATDAEAERLVRDSDAEAAVVGGPRVLAMEENPDDVVDALSTAPPVQLLDPDAQSDALRFLVPFALAFVFFITSFTFGLMIAQSVTEEKQTRVVEILVASVPVRALLAGKVAAMTLLAFGQITLLVLVTFTGMKIADVDTSVFSAVAPALGWFIPFFVLGFLMFASLWAGVGALAARQEDLAGTTAPLQIILMLPFFLTIFLNDKPVMMAIMSYIPFTAPAAMPVRYFQGDAAVWEPVVALVLLAATAVALLALGARMYEGSLLRTNGRTSVATALRTRAEVG